MKDDWSRPGIMLYGANPVEQNFDNFDKIQLKPVMSLKSKIISCQALKKGDTVGYGCDYVATEDMSVGIVACGYGDGYPRSAPTGTPVMLGSHRTSVIGRVSMDMIALDLRGIPKEALGEDVVLWGQSLPIELIAKNAGTISYELFCRVNKRINFSVE